MRYEASLALGQSRTANTAIPAPITDSIKRSAAFAKGDNSELPLEITMTSATVMAAKRP